MSLNGLDAPEVQEAYNTAFAEAGGWFLLKYVSRDTVEVLAQGKAGVTEARASMLQYDELSPVYGMMMYRRRKVLIKYIPEGTSRLLQARTSVHFQDVLEKLTPYEMLLEITSAENLSDTSLAASFPLHTATASPSVSTTRLNEISEDAEEGGAPPPLMREASSVSSLSGRRIPASRSKRLVALANAAPSLLEASEKLSTSPQKSSLSQFLVREEHGQQSITSLSPPSVTEYAPSEASAPDTESIKSGPSAASGPCGDEAAVKPIDTTRPSRGELPDYYDFEKYLLKPKIKHGPRPIAVSERPALSSAGSFGRPTSALPAGVHIKPKQADATPINTEEPAPAASPSLFEFSPLPPPPPIPVAVDLEAARPSSRGSSRSMRSAKTSGSNVTSKSAMTPEKLRLMKAAEMRRRHLKRAQATEQHPTPSPSQEVLGSPKLPRSGAKTNLQNQEQWEPDTLPNVPESNALPNKVDSGIQISDHQSPKSAHASPDLPAKLDEPEEPAVPLMQLAAHKETRETEDVMNDSAHDQIEDARLSIVTGTSGNEFSKPGDLAFVDSPTLGKLVEPTIPEQANMPMSPLPTIVMGDGSRPRCSSQDRAVDQQPPVTATEPQALPPDLQESETFPGMTIRQSQKSADLRKKRRGFIEPLSINTERTDADDIFSSDDELMEELQSATVQEAKFISVSKSPATPFFPRRPSSNSVYSIKSAKSGASVDPMIPRTNSSPLTLMEKLAAATDRLSPGALSSQSRSRSSSSGRTPASEKADPMAIARKGQVSSKISDRIRALAEKSVRETSPPPVATTESIPSGIFAMRKASVRDTSDLQPQPSAPKTGRPMASFTKVAPWPVQATRPTPAPSENQTVYTVQQDPTSKRDSVSVTARIVRRPSTQTGHPSTGEAAPLELQQSPLIINHKRGAASQSNIQPLAPLITDSAALRTKSNAGSTLTDDVLSPVSDAMSPTQSRASMDSHRTSWRKSFGRNKENKNPASASRALSPSSILSDESTSSRTSRFLRRISAIASPKKRDPSPPHSPRSVMPPNAAAYMPSISSVTSQTQPPNASTSITLPAVHIGDLNVQFPDNLVRQTLVDSYGGTRLRDARVLTTWQLWRRRCLDIDADGHLVFSPAKGNDYKKSVVQRFSLREFKEVYVPEIERQELPNSVVLDLPDGSSLQCACEDGAMQTHLLKTLRTYQQAWSAVTTTTPGT